VTVWLDAVRASGARQVVFDLDGTIARLILPWDEWIDEVLHLLPQEHRSPLKTALYEVGGSWGVEYNRLLDAGLLDREAVLAISRRYEGRRMSFEPIPDVVDAIPELAQRARLSVWTNNLHSTAVGILTELGLYRYFELIVGADDVDRGKPSIDGWASFETIAPAEGSILVGDSENDRGAAIAVGCAFADVRD
jgi:phosphoglycolate phosphatase-like HAD superfamily hydrolase